MKKFLYIIMCFILCTVGYMLVIYNIEGFLPPQTDNITTIDIWNNSDENIDNLAFIYDSPQNKLIIPEIKAKERVIYAIDTTQQNLPKTELLLQTDTEELTVINEQRKGVSTEATIDIYSDKIDVRDLSYQWFRYKYKFYYKRFDRIIYGNQTENDISSK